MTGYLHADYAHSFIHVGKPRRLKHAGGWILERQIPHSKAIDGISCYPLFCCSDWSKLHLDLEDLGTELVSLSCVTDPFGNFDPNELSNCFPDKFFPFKQHYIVDLRQAVPSYLSTHHRRNVRKALGQVKVEYCANPHRFLQKWIELYAHLIERHQIKGMRQFSDTAFEQQLKTPGMTVFRAYHGKTTVGMLLWYQQDQIAYYHLGAYSALGYTLKASYALFWHAIQYFSAAGLQYLNLGGGAGIKGEGQDGLSRFKAGWASGTKTAYFGGRIFDRQHYAALTLARGVKETDFFPAYRKGEFT